MTPRGSEEHATRRQQDWDVGRLAARLAGATVRLRRRLHAHPELAFSERRTATVVARRCAALGLQVRAGVGGTGVLADLDSGRPGRTVLIRADMDALPIQEAEDGRPYRSRVPGRMHACGHDGHVAAALAAAAALARLRPTWAGRIRMCFQPAEETDQGAREMIAAGALDGVDYALGQHLMANLATGIIQAGAGPQWAGSDELSVIVRGTGGHAGNPAGTTDPLAAAAELILALESISARHHGQIMTAKITQLTAAAAPNVIATDVTMAGTLRALHHPERVLLLSQINAAARRISAGRSVRIDVRPGRHCPPALCDPAASHTVQAALDRCISIIAVTEGPPAAGSDDMALYLRRVPGSYFRVGAGGADPSRAFPHHHPRFDLDEQALPIATEALARAALALLAPTPLPKT